jgi:phycocyanin-associated, rod
MLGNAVISGRSSSPAKNRVFVYEVTGLKQNDTNDNNSYLFRSSSSVFVRVPYNRMNEEMQRIGRMGGIIVSIQTLESFQNSSNVSDNNGNSKE